MKEIVLYSLLILTAFGSCKKSKSSTSNPSNSTPNPTPVGTMSCQIDGNAWIAKSTSGQGAATLGLYFTHLDSSLTIKGYLYNSSSLTDFTGINITIGHFNGSPGTFSLTSVGAFGQYVVSTDSIFSTQLTPNTGTVTITNFNTITKQVSGIFSYKTLQTYPTITSKTKNITGGIFTNVLWNYSN